MYEPMSCNSSRISTRMNPLIPSFEASKQRPNAKLIEFFFLFIILQFLHGFCSVHIVLFLNKMKLTRGVDVNMKGIMCYYLRQLWPRENKDGRLSNQNFFVFYMREGGVVFVSRLTWTCQTEKKVCLKGKNWFWCKMTRLCCGKCLG